MTCINIIIQMIKKRKSSGSTSPRLGSKNGQVLKSKKVPASGRLSSSSLGSQEKDISSFKNIHENLRDTLLDLSWSEATQIQDGLFSLFDENDESLSASDLHIHTREHSGKTIGYLLFILNRRLKELEMLNSIKPTGEQRMAIILVPDMNRLRHIVELLSAFQASLAKKGLSINIVPFMKQPLRDILDSADSATEMFLVTTPAVLFAAASSESENFAKILSRAHTLVFDKADAMQSDLSITKLSNMISSALTVSGDKAMNQTPQMILVSACYSKNVLKLKQLLRSPLVLTLEMSMGEKDSDVMSGLTGNEASNAQSDSVENTPQTAPSLPRVVNHSCVYVGKSSERYTWIYAIIKHHFERYAHSATISDCPKIIITVSDIQTSYKVQIFLEELGVQSQAFHQYLAKTSKEKLIKAFTKQVPCVVILVEATLPFLADASSQLSRLESSFLSFATHIVSLSRASTDADSFMSTYRLTHEYFAGHSSARGIYPSVTEMITIASVKEDKSLIRAIGGYMQQHACTNGNDNGTCCAGISDSYMKSYQYRCEDIYYTQCTPKRVKRETARSIAKEIKIVEGAASRRKKPSKREGAAARKKHMSS
ncbi:ATP-dependent RNA helicase [Perkinsela sp. CCAP 1560/4]|nr:ATP-dependent RNA helicase [Perkinsela sp. CCAP 1560/4]|eukprot:KNH08981.1 ATP-dependent RNA helicase [Perkinsela sp. CCAP 1560/4]